MITGMDKPLEQERQIMRESKERNRYQEALRLSLAVMKAVEWAGRTPCPDPTCAILLDFCVSCYRYSPTCDHYEDCEQSGSIFDEQGHAPDCQLAGAIQCVEGVLGE